MTSPAPNMPGWRPGGGTRSIWNALLAGIALSVLCSVARPADAHEFRPTVLRVDHRATGDHVVLWKWDGLDPRGIPGDQLEFPEGCVVELQDGSEGTSRVTHADLSCADAPLTIRFPHPPPELVLDLRRDGVPHRVERLTSFGEQLELEPYFDVAQPDSPVTRFETWVRLGIEHILFGPDHLCFVLGLTLLVGTWRRIALVVTGFTVGHTLTLSGAALGVLPPPSSAPVEAVIALSITYLALELTRDASARELFGRQLGLPVAVGFGLVHGFGFAGALAEIGLPPGQELPALAGFNIGVELGQLAFVATVLVTANLIGRVARSGTERFPPQLRIATAYSLGAVSVFWLVERSARILS